MSEPQSSQTSPSSSRLLLKAAWFLLGSLFVVFLVASLGMIVHTLNWIRLHGAALPGWIHPVTSLCEGAFAFSSVGLLLLTIVTVIRNARRA